MILFILGTIAIILLFIGLGFNLAEDEEDESGTLGISWHFNSKQLVAILIGATLIFLSTIKTVPTGHTGIVTTFGWVEDYTLESGLHIMAPWKKVTNMDNRTQKATIEMGCFSSDIQEVNLVYTINYQIDKENAQNIYKTIGTNYFDTVVQPKALEAVKGVFALYNAESLVSSRATLSQDIEKVLAANLEQYNIQIISTSLENIDFTDAFTNAVEAKQVAEQNKLKAQTEQEQLNLEAQASAERKVIEAKADAESALIAAQNDAEVAKVQADSAEYQGQKDAAIMSNIGKQLRDYPELVNYYYVTGWDGKLPDTVLGESSNTLLNLE